MTPNTTIHQAFAELHDPRQQGKIKYNLLDIVFIAICAVVCGCNNWVEIAEFAKDEQHWLRLFLDLPEELPSHDTFGAVFGLLDCNDFSEKFVLWMTLIRSTKSNQLAVDGKYARGSYDKKLGIGMIDIVSAFATDTGLTLAQEKVDAKSNEIVAIPHLLDMLLLKDCVVTIDAIGCQKEIVSKVVGKGGDVIISLKGNQGHLHRDVETMFTYFDKIGFADVLHSHHKTTNKGHGRIETREIWGFNPHDPKYARYFRTIDQWTWIQSVIRVRSKRIIGEKEQIEDRYFISTMSVPAHEHLHYIRSHWSIENQLHWVMDVAFLADKQRTRRANSAASLVILQQIALNLLRSHKSRVGVLTKRKKCSWNKKYREAVLRPILGYISVN